MPKRKLITVNIPTNDDLLSITQALRNLAYSTIGTTNVSSLVVAIAKRYITDPAGTTAAIKQLFTQTANGAGEDMKGETT